MYIDKSIFSLSSFQIVASQELTLLLWFGPPPLLYLSVCIFREGTGRRARPIPCRLLTRRWRFRRSWGKSRSRCGIGPLPVASPDLHTYNNRIGHVQTSFILHKKLLYILKLSGKWYCWLLGTNWYVSFPNQERDFKMFARISEILTCERALGI